MLYGRSIIFLLTFLLAATNYASADCVDDPGEPVATILQLGPEEAALRFRDEFRKTLESEDELACLHYHYGRLVFREGSIDSALSVFSRGAGVLGTDAKGILAHKLNYNCGIIQLRSRRYSNAISWFKKARSAATDPADVEKCNIKIAKCYRESGDLFLANYYLKIAAKNLPQQPDGLNWRIEANGNLGINYNETNQPDSALHYLRIQRRLINSNDPSLWTSASITNYIEQGNAHESMGLYDEAIRLYGISLNESVKYNDVVNRFRAYNNLGYACNQKGEYLRALMHLERSLRIATEDLKDSLRISYVESTIGDAYLGSSSFEEAIEHYYQALTLIIPDFQSDDFQRLPPMQAINSLENIHEVYSHSRDLANGIGKYGSAINDQGTIQLALEYVDLADSILFHINNNSIEHRSKFFWRAEATELYTLAIDLALKLDDLDAAFRYLERNKYFVLRHLIRENSQLANLNEMELSEIGQLKEAIAQADIDRSHTESDPENLRRYIELKEELHIRLTALAEITPTSVYHQIGTEDAFLQNIVADDSTVYISYHLTGEYLYILFVSLDSSWMRTIAYDNLMEQTVRQFLGRVSRPFQTSSDMEAYYTQAYAIYAQLLTNDIEQYPNLIINPSGILNYIPFEALCSDPDKLRLVITDHNVRYSLTPFLSRTAQTSNNGKTLVIAPGKFKDPYLTALPYTIQEAEGIVDVTRGQVLKGNKGTKSAFLSALPHHDNLHLATHAQSGNGSNVQPWLAFYDDKIYLPEIYNLDLKGKFIVLSACETFRGEELEGEGILSLVWALNYSGSRNMVATLWNAFDNAQNELMELFYAEMISGMQQDRALRAAKLKYMESNRIDPCYWASPIYIGQTAVFQNSTASRNLNRRNLLTVFIVFFIIVSLLVYRKKT